MRTLRGEAVDRPAVNFYEIGGFEIDRTDPDRFNIYNSPSWQPLLDLAERETDLIRLRPPRYTPSPPNNTSEFWTTQEWEEGDSKFTRSILNVGGRRMQSVQRRDAGVDTVWEVEHLLKDTDDLRAYLELPGSTWDYDVDVEHMVQAEKEVGERGIVMVDMTDPLCHAAALFSMADYTVVALTEGRLFHRLLAKWAMPIWKRTEQVSAAFPARLWRIPGPEYATPPYLPPRLFEEYVVRYTGPMVQAIHRHGGFARIHCHGRIREVLPYFVKMGFDATDPIEPPPQGNVGLSWVRKEYGKDLVLFGNIEVADIENLSPSEFETKCAASLRDGTSETGRGFVLMPSSCPYGRDISPNVMANCRTMVRLATGAGA